MNIIVVIQQEAATIKARMVSFSISKNKSKFVTDPENSTKKKSFE